MAIILSGGNAKYVAIKKIYNGFLKKGEFIINLLAKDKDMKDIVVWLRNKLRQWLGIERNSEVIYKQDKLLNDLVHIGVDVHFKKPHMILIFSKLNGGQIRHIDADFKDIHELRQFVQEMKERYKTTHTTWDLPPQLRHFE